jgi:hypothetical protein
MAALLIAACAVLGLVLFGRVPADGLWAADLANFAHGPAFAVVTLIVIAALRRGPTREASVGVEYALAIAISVMLGAVVELLQARIGRDAELGDLLRDALGALAGTGLFATVDRKVRNAMRPARWRIGGLVVGVASVTLLLAPLAVTALAYLERNRNFPVLADFSQPFSGYFVSALAEVDAQRASLPPSMVGPAAPATGLRVRPSGDRWWGVMLKEPCPDWRGFDRLAISIANPGKVPLTLKVRFYDRNQQAGEPPRFTRTIAIAADSLQTATIPLAQLLQADGARRLDLADMRSLMLARSAENRAPEFYVTRVWLE